MKIFKVLVKCYYYERSDYIDQYCAAESEDDIEQLIARHYTGDEAHTGGDEIWSGDYLYVIWNVEEVARAPEDAIKPGIISTEEFVRVAKPQPATLSEYLDLYPEAHYLRLTRDMRVELENARVRQKVQR